MEPIPNQPPDQPTATPAPAEEPQEELIPKSKVEAIVRDRLDRDRKSRAKQEPAAQAPKEEPKPSTDADLKARLDFAEMLSDMDWKPSKEDREHLRDAFVSKGAEAMHRLAGRLKPPESAPAPAAPVVAEPAKEPSYKSPGAPAGAPAEVLNNDATKWSSDYVARQREQGTFLQELEKYRSSLPGGTGGLFRKRLPK